MTVYKIKAVLFILFIFCVSLCGNYEKSDGVHEGALLFSTHCKKNQYNYLKNLKNMKYRFDELQKNQAYKVVKNSSKHRYVKHKNYFSPQSKSESPHDIQDVALHFYYMVRLEPIIRGLHMIYSNGGDFLCDMSNGEKECVIVDEHITFSHKRSIDCISSMIKKNNIYPLVELFNDIKMYEALCYDEQLIRESLILSFIVYKKKLAHYLTYNKMQNRVRAHILLDYFDRVYSAIDSLPIQEILEALDAAADELYPILEHYEFNSYMSWEDWLQKYVWLVPILTVKFVYDVFSKLNFIQKDSSEDEENNSDNSSSAMDDLLVLLI